MEYRIDGDALRQCANKEMQCFYRRLIQTWKLIIEIVSFWFAAQHQPNCWGASRHLSADQFVKKLLIRLAECYAPHYLEPAQYKAVRALDIDTAVSTEATQAERRIFGAMSVPDTILNKVLILYQDKFTAA
jgi:hypothetical protein